jgi:hypothetical protein
LAAKAETVPVASLHSALAKASSSPIPRFLLGGTLCVLLGALVWVYKVFTAPPEIWLDPSPVLAHFQTHDADAAIRWIAEGSDLRLPVIHPRGPVQLLGADRGKDWASMDYFCNLSRGNYTLFVSRKAEPLLQGKPERRPNGQVFYHGEGIGWVSAEYAYYLTGGSEGGRRSIAAILSEQTRVVRTTTCDSREGNETSGR